MKQTKIFIEEIPAIIWGEKSDKVFLYVHGKFSRKEYASQLATQAAEKGWQTLSFDLPEHGDRLADKSTPFNIFTCMDDAKKAADFAFSRWKKVSLFAVSIGAQISLQTFSESDRRFDEVLFLSPIIDMNHLIQKMFGWYGISEQELYEKKMISTELDTMTVEQFEFYKSHPVTNWSFKTQILFGAKDEMQTREIHEAFLTRSGGKLTVSETSEHPFMAKEDFLIVETWLKDCLS